MHSLECQESELSEAAQANIAKLSEEIRELNEVIEEKKGAHSRLKLEIDNFRQRTKSELASARGKAAIPLVQELLPIADEYEYAKQNLKIETDGQKAVVTKFEALFDKMLQSWKSLGIEKMNSVGETFNPELHEAVSMIPSQEYKEAGMSCVWCRWSGYSRQVVSREQNVHLKTHCRGAVCAKKNVLATFRQEVVCNELRPGWILKTPGWLNGWVHGVAVVLPKENNLRCKFSRSGMWQLPMQALEDLTEVCWRWEE